MTHDRRHHGRRRTDRDRTGLERHARRMIAEEAYRLFVEVGFDRSKAAECWRVAEERVLRVHVSHD